MREHQISTPSRRPDGQKGTRRITTGVVMVALVTLVGLACSPRATERPASQPTSEDIFADVHGWIAYGDPARGIKAVDPAQPGDLANQVLLSSEPGIPRAWSADGSKLLILREAPDAESGGIPEMDFFVLNADGTETRLTDAHEWVTGGSFSPDGTEIVYAAGAFPSSIFVVDAEGGTPRLLRPPRRDLELYAPTFSPDGAQVAYFEGDFENYGHSLRVMNADGSGDRELVFIPPTLRGRSIENLVWSPDGSRLLFSPAGGGIWVVRADGSGLTKVIPAKNHSYEAADPHWSPDSSRISYNNDDDPSIFIGDIPMDAFHQLEIAHWDGTQVETFGHGRSGPWNPLDR